MDRPERVLVLGAGAIGGAIGALLFAAGAPCLLIARGEQGRAIAAGGVDLRFPAGARRVRVPAVDRLARAAPGRRDLVLLATMGHHTEAALADLPPAVPVVSMQNGLAPLEAIARRGHPAFAALLYLPAARRAPGQIALPGSPRPGSVLVGAWPRGAHPWMTWLAARLVAAGVAGETEPDIAPWIRAKLLTNLGGIVAALCDAPAADVVDAAQAEARAVWRATGQAFVDVGALVRRVGPLASLPVDGRARVGGSTRAALERGEPLETATLHGGIVADGRAAGIATPVNRGLIELAETAARERWRPGCLTPDALRRRLSVSR